MTPNDSEHNTVIRYTMYASMSSRELFYVRATSEGSSAKEHEPWHMADAHRTLFVTE